MRNFSAHTDAALSEPLVLTRNGRDRLVVLSVQDYRDVLALALLSERADRELPRLAGEFNLLSDPEPAPAERSRRRNG